MNAGGRSSRLLPRTDVTPVRGIVILEGADHSGKTTLARVLLKKYGGHYLHGRVFRNMWRSHVAMMRLALRWADTQLVVIDRIWLSELVYGPIYRGGAAYDLGARCLDRLAMRVGAVTVLCAPDDQQYQIQRHADRAGKGLEVFHNIEMAVNTYADLARGNLARDGDSYLAQLIRYGDYAERQDVVVYDLDRQGHRLPQVCKQIITKLQKLQKDQLPSAMISSRQNFTGNLATAHTVIVGDIVSPQVARLPKGPRWPMAWHDGMCAATWLNKALHMFGHDETTTIITNGNDPDDHLTDLIDHRRLRIVTLGKSASDSVMSHGVVPDAELEHPQYHRRFHHSDIADYSLRLKQALTCEVSRARMS